MTDESAPPGVEEFVEQLGELFARAGQQRIAGRLLGWLLICDPPHQWAGDIQEAIGASKASVSINLRLLRAAGLVERIGVPGERRAFYQIRIDCWSSDLRGKLAEISAMRRIADHGLKALDRTPAERRERLQRMRDFYAFFEHALPELIDRWEQEGP